MKKKLSILLFCVLGALIVLLGVITYINFQSGDKYKKQVLSQAQQKYQNRTMPAKRGTIYDRSSWSARFIWCAPATVICPVTAAKTVHVCIII